MTGSLAALMESGDVFGLRLEGTRFDIGNPIDHIAAQITATLKDDSQRHKMLETLRKIQGDLNGLDG